MNRLLTRSVQPLVAAIVAALASFVPAAAHAQITFLNTWADHAQITGVGVGPTGSVYVAESDTSRVQAFSSTGVYQSTIGGTFGFDDNQLGSPSGVGVSPNGTIYVADSYNEQVKGFDPSGNYQSTIGTSFRGNPGSGNYGFDDPDGVAVGPTGTVYVADDNNARVQVFNSSGVYQSTIGNMGSGGVGNNLGDPEGVTVSPTGTIYVVDAGNNRVQIFDPSGGYQSTIGGTFGTGNNQLKIPSGVAVGPTGMVYIADTLNDRVEVFNSSGIYQVTLGTTGIYGTGNNQLNTPSGVAVSPTGMVYIADNGNGRIVRYFDPNSWTSGTNTFTDPTSGPTSLTVGAGQILGSSLTLNSPMGLIVGNTLTIASAGTLAQSGGTLTSTTFNISGAFNYQGGIFFAAATNLNSGGSFNGSVFTVPAGQSLTQNGGAMDVSAFTIAGNFLYQSGSLSSSIVTLGPGGSFSAPTANGFTLPAGTTFEADQGGTVSSNLNLYISSAMSLDGGTTLSAGGQVGVLSGGLLAVGNASVSASSQVFLGAGGELRLTNAAEASVTSPSIYNFLGLIDGSGRINGSLNNQLGAEVNADVGQSLTLTSSNNKNYGLISLTGGTLHFTQNLINQSGSQINGYGTLRVDGGLTNFGGASISLGGGQPANVFGNIDNENGTLSLAGSAYIFGTVNNVVATIHLSGNTPNVFYGAVTNGQGSFIRIDAGAMGLFYGGVTGLGNVSNLGVAQFETNSTAGAVSGAGSTSLVSAVTLNAGSFAQGGLTLQLGGVTAGSYSKLDVTGLLNLSGNLAVSLISGFTPVSGNQFDILDWGTLSGTFSSLTLPALSAGLTWNTSQLYTTGVLSVVGPGIPGDYNGNGIVDAADYVVWRANQGTSNVLANDPIRGMIGTAQFNQWRAHFGQTAGSGAAITYTSASAVPEPTSIVLLGLALSALPLAVRGSNRGDSKVIGFLWRIMLSVSTAGSLTDAN